jgi:hypothetical protein
LRDETGVAEIAALMRAAFDVATLQNAFGENGKKNAINGNVGAVTAEVQ